MTTIGKIIVIHTLIGLALVVSYTPAWVGLLGLMGIVHAATMLTIAVLMGRPLIERVQT